MKKPLNFDNSNHQLIYALFVLAENNHRVSRSNLVTVESYLNSIPDYSPIRHAKEYTKFWNDRTIFKDETEEVLEVLKAILKNNGCNKKDCDIILNTRSEKMLNMTMIEFIRLNPKTNGDIVKKLFVSVTCSLIEKELKQRDDKTR